MRVEPELPINPKFRRLKTAVGDVAMECLITIWAHCQQNQRGEYWHGADAAYVEMICNWTGQRGELFRALVECGHPKVGFIIPEPEGLRIHEWEEMNCQMVGNWRRNPSGRKTRTATPTGSPTRPPMGNTHTPPRTPTPSATPTGSHTGYGSNPQMGLGQNGETAHLAGTTTGSNDAPSGDSQTPTGSPTPPQRLPQRTVEPVSLSFCLDQAAGRIALLNQLTGSKFNPPLDEQEEIAARLLEVNGDVAGVDQMIRRQCRLWMADTKTRQWLKPSTLFGPRFHDYYGQRELSTAPTGGSSFKKTGAPREDRTELLQTLAATRAALEQNPGDTNLRDRVAELEAATA